jgi:hypothetical protein
MNLLKLCAVGALLASLCSSVLADPKDAAAQVEYVNVELSLAVDSMERKVNSIVEIGKEARFVSDGLQVRYVVNAPYVTARGAAVTDFRATLLKSTPGGLVEFAAPVAIVMLGQEAELLIRGEESIASLKLSITPMSEQEVKDLTGLDSRFVSK